MMFSYLQFYLLYFVLFFVTVVPLLFAVYFRKLNRGATSKYFLGLMMACFIYSFAYILELILADLELKIEIIKFQYLGAVFFGPLMLLMTIKYTGFEIFRLSRLLPILFLIPIGNLILVWTNEYHHFFYTSFSLSNNGIFDLMTSEKGWAYWVHQGYTISLLFISLGLLGRMIRQVPAAETKQVYMVILGLCSPLLVYLWYLTGSVPYQIDPIPFGFLGTGVFVYLGLKKFKLFKIAPIAYRTLFDNMKEGVMVTDNYSNFVTCNLSAKKILGNDPLHDIDIIYEKWPEILNILTDTESHKIQETYRWMDGYQHWYLLTKSEILDQQQKGVGSILMIRDISQEKNYQLEIEQSKEEAELANKAKSEFLANMSHEIRTPLNGVIGFTELLTNTKLNDQQERYAQTVLNSANALLDLINDILDLAKIDAGKVELNINKIDLIELLETIVDVLSFQAHQKDLELILGVEADVPKFIYIDELKLKQVLINLLNNALKFTLKGEVILKVSCLEDSSRQGNETVSLRFSVTDSGIGIEEGKQQLIFDAFSQADSSTTKKFGGTGLGLTISNKLLHLLGSGIKMSSRLNQGSEFYFDLNLQCCNEQIEYPDYKSLSEVLLIDNNYYSAQNIQTYCKNFGTTCKITDSINQAFNWVDKEHDFKVIMLNRNTLGKNSLSAMLRIMDLEKGKSKAAQCVTILGSNDSAETIEAYRKIGCFHILVKPVTSKKMKNLFYKLLHGEKASHVVNLKDRVNENEIKLKILFIEDNPINRVLIKTYFQRLYPNTEIFEASTGEIGFQMFLRVLPDLVITDINMPEMNGYELCEAIRNHPKGEIIPVIGCSANVFDRDKEKAGLSGFNDYLTKPVSQKEFEKIMDKWIAKVKKQ